MTRCFGLPRASVALSRTGIVWFAKVDGPVHHVSVPSARAAVTRSICSPNAATTTPNGCDPATDTPACVEYTSPENDTLLVLFNDWSTVRYSRMWRTGFSNDMPIMFSITIWWLSPIPRHRRPPTAAFTVRHCCASIIGWRGYVGTTAVPSSMRGTSRPISARSVNASWAKICGIQ